MASKTEVCNLAIRHCGSSATIANIDEDSQEANACDAFYDICLDELQRDFKWPFTTVIATLAVVEEDPNDEWAFSYQYPTACLRFDRILSGIRNDNRQSRIPYRRIEGNLVLCDLEDAVAEYGSRVTDTSKWPPDFLMSFSYRLAAYICPQITGGDPFKITDRCMQLFAMANSKARANAVNEEQDEEVPESDLIRSRG